MFERQTSIIQFHFTNTHFLVFIKQLALVESYYFMRNFRRDHLEYMVPFQVDIFCITQKLPYTFTWEYIFQHCCNPIIRSKYCQ